MDWRSFGVKHTIEDVGTFWWDKGTPYRAELLVTKMELWGDDTHPLLSTSFTVVEGYVVDFDPSDDEHYISLYMKNRMECDNLKARWELFQRLLRDDNASLLLKAWEHTRPKEFWSDPDEDPGEKKSATSEPPASTPSKKKSVTAN